MNTTQPTPTADDTRSAVSRAYAEAVTRASSDGCCAPTTCCDTTDAGDSPAARIGYSADDLAHVPEDAARSAFGCGNPIALSEIGEGDVVVDLGSGAGIDLVLAAERVGPTGRVIGVDMTAEMIERARANVATTGHVNIEVREGIIEALPIEDASVDWVISNCVLNLSPEKDRVFAEIARVLKPGGRMLVSDIVADGLPDWARDSASLYVACVAGAIPEVTYLGGLRAAGLEEVEVRDRLVYDGPQLLGLVGTERETVKQALADAGFETSEEALAGLADQIAGKVASIRVHARKPG